HMMFVGYSLSDDYFHRLVHQVRDAIGASAIPGQPSGPPSAKLSTTWATRVGCDLSESPVLPDLRRPEAGLLSSTGCLEAAFGRGPVVVAPHWLVVNAFSPLVDVALHRKPGRARVALGRSAGRRTRRAPGLPAGGGTAEHAHHHQEHTGNGDHPARPSKGLWRPACRLCR